MLQAWLSSFDLYSWQVFGILIISSFFVGIINTLAGSASVITFSILMALGIPAPMANGTIRIGVIVQTGVASFSFFRNNKLELRKGLILGIPITIGSIIGALFAINLSHELFEKIVGVVLLILLFFLFFDPKRWIQEQQEKTKKKVSILQFLIFLLVGIYGGFIHIGVGIFLLTALVLQAGYDLVKANALKVFLVLLYSPFALGIYILDGQIEWVLGLVAAIGNIAGGWVGSQLAIKKGSNFIRGLLIIVILVFSGHLLGIWEAIAN
jgi:uncharacterized protein